MLKLGIHGYRATKSSGRCEAAGSLPCRAKSLSTRSFRLVETAESAFRPRRSPLVKKINMHRLKPSVSAVPKSDHQRIHSSDPLGNSNSPSANTLGTKITKD